MKTKSKLIRNLKPGDVIEVTDASRSVTKTYRVTIVHVQETRSGWFTGRRMWLASFKPAVSFTWDSILGYSDSRVNVYEV